MDAMRVVFQPCQVVPPARHPDQEAQMAMSDFSAGFQCQLFALLVAAPSKWDLPRVIAQTESACQLWRGEKNDTGLLPSDDKYINLAHRQAHQKSNGLRREQI